MIEKKVCGEQVLLKQNESLMIRNNQKTAGMGVALDEEMDLHQICSAQI